MLLHISSTSNSGCVHLYLFYLLRKISFRGTASTSVDIGSESSRVNTDETYELQVMPAPLSDENGFIKYVSL